MALLCASRFTHKIWKGINMATLTQVELNSIREMVTGHKTTAVKLCNYAQKCNDPKIKQMFQTASNEADTSAANLLKML